MELDAFVKLALEEGKRRRLSAIDTVRPYARKALAGASAGLWTGMNVNKLRQGSSSPRRAVPLALAALGAVLGLSDEKLRRMSRHPKYKEVLKETRREA